MKKLTSLLILILLLLNYLVAQETTEIVQLKYISPGELIVALDLKSQTPNGYQMLLSGSSAFLRINNANNQLLVNGDSEGVKKAMDVIAFMDVPPRQIVIEAKIVEIDNQKSRETGIDWQNILNRTSLNMSINRLQTEDLRQQDYPNAYGSDTKNKTTTKNNVINAGAGVSIGDVLKLVEEKNVGSITSVPKIVTTNNKMGKIMDGSRITYVTRYSSYTNLYETQEMNAGLSLSVTPSIGESGYLKLDVQAKFTALGEIISGSPSETGQILENTVIAKNKESFLLGAFKQTEKRKQKKGVPLLGIIMPFFFSRDVQVETTKDVLIILTPEIIDLNPASVPEIKDPLK
jgi:type II secretory pathway component GspD/PulD (secretin)